MRRSEIQWACGNAEIGLSLALPFDFSVVSFSTNSTHTHRRPHVTIVPVAKFLPLLPLPRYHLAPHPPDVLFYFIIRPDLGELGWLPRRIYRETSLLPQSLPLFLLFPLLLSLISSATAARFSTNGETGISASNARIFCCCCCCAPYLFCLRHLLLEARLQLVCLGFGTSRRREDPSRVILLFVLATRRYRYVSVARIIKIMHVIPEKSRNITRIYTTGFFDYSRRNVKKRIALIFPEKLSSNRLLKNERLISFGSFNAIIKAYRRKPVKKSV